MVPQTLSCLVRDNAIFQKMWFSDASVVNAAKYKCSKHPSLPLKKTVTPNDCNDLQFVRSVLVIMHFMYTTAISDESQLYTNMRVRK